MKKEEARALNDLSVKWCGNPYAWRKLTKRGMVVGHDQETGYVRRMSLTPEQAKSYMEKAIEMRNKVLEEMKNEKG